MSKNKDFITVNELTLHFIKFAKIIGIFPKIMYLFRNRMVEYGPVLSDLNVGFWQKNGFLEYAEIECYWKTVLNDNVIRKVYLFGYDEWQQRKQFENDDDIINLFFSYLHDYGYLRYIELKH